MNPLVYFSSQSENTHRFVGKLGLPAIRIPIGGQREKLRMTQPYILVVPSYGGGSAKGAVPIQVIHFLNDEQNAFVKNFKKYFWPAPRMIRGLLAFCV